MQLIYSRDLKDIRKGLFSGPSNKEVLQLGRGDMYVYVICMRARNKGRVPVGAPQYIGKDLPV